MEPNRATATDPVCGMRIDAQQPKGGTHAYGGQTWGFCNPRCRDKFIADPERYLRAEPAPPAHPHSGAPAHPATGPVEYTCPMHPEIVRDAPGACPICGMALEPRTVTGDDQPNPELVDMTRRFWLSLVPTLPVFALSMSEMLPGQPVQHALGSGMVNWIQAVLATPVV